MDFEDFQIKYKLFNKDDNHLEETLDEITPSGNTALRDSIGAGVKLIMQMNTDISQNEFEERHFLHIVVTDGEDTCSKIKFEELAAIFLIVGRFIPKRMITNHFIGVGFSPNSEEGKQLKALSILGGDTSELHFAETADIEGILQRIQAEIGRVTTTQLSAIGNRNIGIVSLQQQSRLVLNFSKKKFIVVFNIDISGSMADGKWTKLRQCVSDFAECLNDDDLIALIVFNDQPKLCETHKVKKSSLQVALQMLELQILLKQFEQKQIKQDSESINDSKVDIIKQLDAGDSQDSLLNQSCENYQNNNNNYNSNNSNNKQITQQTPIKKGYQQEYQTTKSDFSQQPTQYYSPTVKEYVTQNNDNNYHKNNNNNNDNDYNYTQKQITKQNPYQQRYQQEYQTTKSDFSQQPTQYYSTHVPEYVATQINRDTECQCKCSIF